jgi:hypothetical protein
MCINIVDYKGINNYVIRIRYNVFMCSGREIKREEKNKLKLKLNA